MRLSTALSTAFLVFLYSTSLQGVEYPAALQSLLEALKRFDSVDLKAGISTTTTMRPSRGHGKTWEQILEVKRNNARAIVSLTSKNPLPDGGMITFLTERILYANGDVFSTQARLYNDSMEQVEGVNDDLLFGLHSKEIAGTQSIDRKSLYFDLNDSGIACWIIGYWSLHDQIESAEKLTSRNSGDSTVIIDCESIYGRLRLEASKDHDWLPNKITLVKLPEHMSNGRLVGEINMTGDGEVWPDGGVKQIAWRITVDEFDRSDGFAYPKRMSVLREVLSQQGPLTSIATDIAVEKCVFRQNFDESEWLTKIKAPAGHSVTIRGAEHLPYVWNGEKAVPKAASLSEIAVSIRNRVWNRGGLIAVNLVFLAIVFYLLWKNQGATA